MAVTPKGVRMINNNVVQSGMALVMTDRDVMDWNHIPDGSLFVHPKTGDIMIKVEGESDWIPLPDHIKKDGTLVISRDTSLHVEVFKIISIDEENHQFVYEDEDGNRQTKIKDENGFVFQLKGSYLPGRNHLTVTFDDVLDRSAASGGIVELDEHRFRVVEDIPVGTEVTARYIQWVRIGNPYPRWYEAFEEPEAAEIGDFLLDLDDTVEELFGDIEEPTSTEPKGNIEWSRIISTPTTLSGYGILDNVSYVGHTHSVNDIVGLTNAINSGVDSRIQSAINNIVNGTTKVGKAAHADTAEKLKVNNITYALDTAQAGGSGAKNKIALYDANGQIPVAALPTKLKNSVFVKGMIIDWYGASNAIPAGWALCDGATHNGIATPDLRNKFIIGAGSTYAWKATGGAASVSLKKANLPPHDHTHTHKHKHSRGTMNITGRVGAALQDYAYPTGPFYTGSPRVPEAADGNWGNYSVHFDASKNWTGYTSEDATANSSSTNSSDFKSTAFSTLPPYYALFKIMYVGV